MSFWAFTKGAASTLRKEIEREEMAEEERMEWQRRLEFQQKLQEQAEKAKRDRETLMTSVDTKRGVLQETTRSGQVNETKLPQAALDQIAEEKAAKAAELERKALMDGATLEQKRAAAEASKAAAASSLAAQARLNERAKYQNKADEARAGYYERGGSGGRTNPEEKKLEKEVDTLFSTVSKRESPRIKAAAERIRFSTLSPEQKAEALRELLDAEE